MPEQVSYDSRVFKADLRANIDGSDLSAAQWSYLTEGNANAIFQYNGNDARLQDTVIRLQKQTSSFDPAQQVDYFQKVLSLKLDRIKEHVLQPRLVSLSPDFLDSCVAERAHATGKIPYQWRGSELKRSAICGILLPSLVSSTAKLVLEFKPKWLRQSPSAPSDATLCRTCALKSSRDQRPASRDRFCPLHLVSQNAAQISRAVRGLNLERQWHLSERTTAALVEYFTTTSVLQQLASIQRQCEDDLPLCMTLRDCSIYLVLAEGNVNVESVWIADLDRKSATKQAHWVKVEQGLIDGGWYHKVDSTAGNWSCTV